MNIYTVGSRNGIKELNWSCIELSIERVIELRQRHDYFDWFDATTNTSRYAIFSVHDAYEFWFEDGRKAIEFALRFQ